MPLFGRSKKAQEAKKQEEAAAPKPAPYRHVPKHAASDASSHGFADGDKAAQQQRIMAASQSRLNSMNSNYAVKQNFAHVPTGGGQAQSFVFSASNSSRNSFGNASRRDASAVQPGSPAGAVPPSLRAQQEYVKLRNPSLLSKTTSAAAPATSRSLPTAKNAAGDGGIAYSDSGYGSVGQVSRPESKAPSTISKAPSELRHSQDLKSVPSASTGVDFLPKLDFSPESSRQQAAPSVTVPSEPSPRPISIVTSRDRAVSNSSYVSRLDPGSDRRSIVSTQSKPFDQIDFSKPGQQFIPSPTRTTRPTSSEFSEVNRPESPTIQHNTQPSSAIQQSERDKFHQTPATTIGAAAGPAVASAAPLEREYSPPPQTQERYADVEPKSVRQQSDVTRQSAEAKRSLDEQTMPKARPPVAQASQPTLNSHSEQESLPPQSAQIQAQSQPSTQVDNDRGRRAPHSGMTPFPPIEESSRRNSSTSQSQRSERRKSQSTRHRNWSRPSQSSGSQLDYDRKDSSSSLHGMAVKSPPQFSLQDGHQNPGTSTREAARAAQDETWNTSAQPIQRAAQNDQTLQAQQTQGWNDQASSIYGDSTHNASTRQHSPVRRQSYAPSEVLDRVQTANSSVAPLSILDGLKVNKRGKILDEEGEPIGELVEGDIIDCVRQKANAFGQVLDDYGRVVGRVVAIGRGGGVRSQSPATTIRSRGFPDYHSDLVQRYPQAEQTMISPVTTTLGRPFEPAPPEEDPRQRAAALQAAAAPRSSREPDAHIELDGSGYAEAAPLVDHSEIFLPPFIPSRSPKRSPAEPAPHGMDSYFAPPLGNDRSAREEPLRLKRWASRNLEQDRDEVLNNPRPAPQPPVAAPVQTIGPTAPEEPVVSRPSTPEAKPKEQKPAGQPSQPTTGAQDFISSDQPRDIYPWMTNPSAQDNGKWSSNIFTYKGEVPRDDAANKHARSSSVRSAQASSPSAFATNSAPLMKHYMPQLTGSAGSRKSNRTSFREHVPHVKSPLSTHNSASMESSGNDGAASPASAGTSTPRPGSSHTTASTATSGTRKRTYFTHGGRQSIVVPDGAPTHTNGAASTSASPTSSNEGAMAPPDVVRKAEMKKKSRWSMSGAFGKKASSVRT